MQASALRVIGWVDDPDTYPIQPKPHTLEYLREVAHLRPRTNVIGAATRVRHSLAKEIHRFFDEHGFSDKLPVPPPRGGRARIVPRLDPGLANLPPTPNRRVDLAPVVLSPRRGVPRSCWAARDQSLLPRRSARLASANFPRRKLQHQPPPRRILDDRAGDAFRTTDNPYWRRHSRGTPSRRAEGARKTCILRPAHRARADREARKDRWERIRAHGLQRGDPRTPAVDEKFEYPVRWGVDLQSEHERYLTEKYSKRPVI